MNMVPQRFLHKTGNYKVLINGVEVEVKLADTAAAIDKAVTGRLNYLVYRNNVVGLNYITSVSLDSRCSCGLLVLCGIHEARNYVGIPYCLVIQLDYLNNEVSESLKKLLSNPDICFVRASSELPSQYDWLNGGKAIKSIQVGELAARVLNKPDLQGSSLSQIASEVGVPSLEVNGSSQIRVEQKYMRVLTAEQVKNAVVDAYACAKIGVKLLCSS